MKELFKTMYGSKLYGTSTPQSDTDWKVIVLPPLKDLLIGKEIQNKVKTTNTEEFTKNSADDVDMEFIPIQVFAKHFLSGQTYAYELAWAVDGTHAGQVVDPKFKEFVYFLRKSFLTKNMKSMMGYAVNQASLYSFKGERLNVVNEFIDIISKYDNHKDKMGTALTDPSIQFLLEGLETKYPKYFVSGKYDIGRGRTAPAFFLLEKTLPLTNSVEHTLMVAKGLSSKYGDRAKAASADNVDWKAVMHSMRIMDEGIALLTEKKLEFPLNNDKVAEYLSIRRGEKDFEELKVELNEKLEHLKQLEINSNLIIIDDDVRNRFDEFLYSWMLDFYEV